MSNTVYITDPVVAAAYHVHPAEWATVPDGAEAAWLVSTHQAYPLDGNRAMPDAFFVHPAAPQPFVPYDGSGGGETPPDRVPANMTVTIGNPRPNEFDVVFGGNLDAVDALAHFVLVDDQGATVADVTYTQPRGTERQDAAGLLKAALASYPLALTKNGAILDIRGNAPPVLTSVTGELTIPASVTRRSSRRRTA